MKKLVPSGLNCIETICGFDGVTLDPSTSSAKSEEFCTLYSFRS